MKIRGSGVVPLFYIRLQQRGSDLEAMGNQLEASE